MSLLVTGLVVLEVEEFVLAVEGLVLEREGLDYLRSLIGAEKEEPGRYYVGAE